MCSSVGFSYGACCRSEEFIGVFYLIRALMRTDACWRLVPVGTVSVYQNSPRESEADMAYAERRDSANGPRYRGFY
jgi:hypothetical protein